jgi:hypothetical protein
MYKYFTFIILIMAISCNSSKKLAFDPMADDSDFIKFGGGGGFTGKVNTYFLTKKGKMYTLKDEKYEKIASIPAPITDQVFKNFTNLGLDKMILNDPGNKYNFIERKENAESTTLKWGNKALDNKSIQTYYKILMKLVKDALPTSDAAQ